jgi:3-dehydroquinate synthase
MAEVWKVAFGLSEGLYRSLLSKPHDTETMVRTCIDLKRRLVEEDEFELGSARAKLNIGHTIGHALENLGGYRELLHGEAVSIGIVQETRLAESLGIAEKGTAAEVSRALEAEGLPITSPYMKDVEKLIPLMKSDKKSTERRLAFCFITRIGECRLVRDVDEHEVKKVLSSE